MRTGVVVGGIVFLILGSVGMRLGFGYKAAAGEVAGEVVTAIGIITGGVGATLSRSKVGPSNRKEVISLHMLSSECFGNLLRLTRYQFLKSIDVGELEARSG